MTTSVISNIKIKAVNEYTAAGFAIFPCVSKEGTKFDIKAPALEGWREIASDPLLMAADLPSTYGIVLQEDDFILDVDPRRFRSQEDNQLTALWKELQLPPELLKQTFIVTTGGGGLHIYLKKPKNFPVRSTVPGYPAIEIKTAGQYVIGAGSMHGVKNKATGKQYIVERGTPRQISKVPQVLLDYCWKNEAERKTVGEMSDSQACKTRFIQFLLGQPGVAQGGRDATTYKHACEGRDYGLSKQVCYELLAEYFNPRNEPELTEEELKGVVQHAYKYAQNKGGSLNPLTDFSDVEPPKPKFKILWDIGREGLKPTLNNCLNYLLMDEWQGKPNPLQGLIRYNVFSQEIEFIKPAPWHDTIEEAGSWTDNDTAQFKSMLSAQQHFNASDKVFFDALLTVALRNKYHPVKQWLDSLVWDGTPRLDKFLVRYAGAANSPYVREVGKNTLIAAVARIYRPGIKHDCMLVLEGVQGLLKSTLVEVLGGKWYATFPIASHDKDTISNMLGMWFVEAAEMEFIKREEVGALKAFLTTAKDRVRLPYGRFSQSLPRQCVMIGTVNPNKGGGYLRDATGNRRFWPVACNRIDIAALKQDRDQLFAEAMVRFRAGEPHWIVSKEIEEHAKGEQAKRMMQDHWLEIIEDWLTRVEEMPDVLTTAVVVEQALMLPAAKLTQDQIRRVTAAMRELGFRSASVYSSELKKNVGSWVKDELHGL